MDCKFTSREKEVMELLPKGLSNLEIANILCVSRHTVKAVLEHIYDKTNIHNRVALACWIVKKEFEKY